MNKYYPCPIKALYMMKEFNVELVRLYNYPRLPKMFEHISFEDMRDLILPWFNAKDERKYRIYVYEESILKPREGDYVLFNDEIGKVIDYDRNRNLFQIRFGEIIEILHQEQFKIVFRDGKQFFMPEVEND